MAEEKVRKTTAKKTIRRTTTKVAPRKTAARKTASSTVAHSTPASVPRKAPSRFSPQAAPRRKSKKKLIAGTLFFLVMLCASIAIGYTDKGQIDVSSVIATRKGNATPEEQQAFQTVPVQQTQNNLVNGGLVGSGNQNAQTPPQQEVLPVSTSTEPAASSTEVDSTDQNPQEGTQDAQEEVSLSEETDGESAQ